MKKTLLILVISFGFYTQMSAQDTIRGLRILTDMPISEDLNTHDSILVQGVEAYAGIGGAVQIGFRTMLSDSTIVTVPYIGGVVRMDSVAYDWTPAYELLKAYFEAKGLTIQDIY